MYFSIILFCAGLALASANHIVEGPNTRTISFGPDGSAIDSVAQGGVIFDGRTPLVLPSTIRNYVHPSVIPFVSEASLPYVASGLVPGRVFGAPFINPPAGVPFYARSFYESAFYPPGLPVPYGKAVVSGPSGTIVADHS